MKTSIRRPGLLAAASALAALLAAPSPLPAAEPSPLPRGVVLPKGVKVPNDTVLAIYVPESELQQRAYLPSAGLWIEPGRALEESRGELAQKLFPQVAPAKPGIAGGYGLLLAVHPDWSLDGGTVKLELRYRVFDGAGTLVREATRTQTAGINASGALGGFRVASYKAMQVVLVDVLRELEPSAEKYPATQSAPALPLSQLVRRERPVSTGTAFVLNKSGQLLTAAHVLRDCVLIEAQKDGQTFAVTRSAASDLLDLAVVDSGRELSAGLPLRVGQTLMLGEGITNVGYPLQGLLAPTPNVTRGNVSARAGLKDSLGIFQFSAPIQPGSSGGPVVSDGGELLGVTVGTLNVGALARNGLVPQNVNFALDARHVAQFLRREGIEFVEVAPRTDGGMQAANEAALGAVAQLSCYQ